MIISEKIERRNVVELKKHPKNELYNSDLDVREEAALKASIAEVGVQEALLIKSDGTILSGHQRRRIAGDLGITELPTRIVECDEKEELYLLVSANEARRGEEKDLMKKARRIKVLYENWGIRQGPKNVHDAHFYRQDVASTLGLDGSSIRRLLKLLYLIPELQKEVTKGTIGLISGNKIARLDPDKQKEFFRDFQISGAHLKMRDIEKLIEKLEGAEADEAIADQKQEQRQIKQTGKIEKLEKSLVMLMTEELNDESRASVAEILGRYAVRFKQRGPEFGEINN